MKDSQIKARETRFRKHIETMDLRSSSEKQLQRIKDGKYEDTRERVQ